MKSSNKIVAIIAIVIFTLLTGTTFAQATASATASATIVAQIGITSIDNMNFGNVAVSTNPGTLILTAGGSISVTGRVTLPKATGTIAPAKFAVTGEGAFAYSITLPHGDYSIVRVSGSETMTVNTFTSSPSGTGTLTSGAQTLKVGATLNVSGSQVAGVYTNAGKFNITVNYN